MVEPFAGVADVCGVEDIPELPVVMDSICECCKPVALMELVCWWLSPISC